MPEIDTAPSAATSQKRGFMNAVLDLVHLSKSLDEASLRDLEPIASSLDSHEDSHGIPTSEEVPTGRPQAMRGSSAKPEVDAHSELKPQEGLTRDYQEFDARLAAMEKSMRTVAGVLKGLGDSVKTAIKAEEDAEKDEEKKEAEKAASPNFDLAARKARVALRKTEDEDDDAEERKACAEKAEAAIKAFSDLVSKAEDDVETDEDEKKAEKARKDLKALKSALKTVKDSFVASKTEEEPEKTEDKPEEKDEAAKSQAALTEFMTQKGISVNDLMGILSGDRSTSSAIPPNFAKAARSNSIEDINRRLEDASDNGTIDSAVLVKADSILSRLSAARNGTYDMDLVTREIMSSDPAIRDIFALQTAV